MAVGCSYQQSPLLRHNLAQAVPCWIKLGCCARTATRLARHQCTRPLTHGQDLLRPAGLLRGLVRNADEAREAVCVYVNVLSVCKREKECVCVYVCAYVRACMVVLMMRCVCIACIQACFRACVAVPKMRCVCVSVCCVRMCVRALRAYVCVCAHCVRARLLTAWRCRGRCPGCGRAQLHALGTGTGRRPSPADQGGRKGLGMRSK